MQFFFAPVLGGLSDRFGRRAVILMSLLGAAASYLLSGFAPSLGWLFVGRVIAGATGASFSAANAYVADVTPPEKRAQSFGLVGAAFGLGFIIGPALGGAIGDLGLRLPYFVAAGLNCLNFLYGLFVLPESLPLSDRRPFSLRRANPLGSIKNLGRHPIVLGLTGTMTCAFMSQMLLQSVWTLYHQASFDWTLRGVGMSRWRSVWPPPSCKECSFERSFPASESGARSSSVSAWAPWATLVSGSPRKAG
jgi:DHA1 family tetracycline resistance protein-like MFS transporter